MNHYENFNDPFECRCDVFSGFPRKTSRSIRLKKVIQAWGFQDGNDPAALNDYEDLVLSLENTEPNVQAIINSARISCFSEEADNLLMWAHYANGLRGFCLEFDEAHFVGKLNAGKYEVIYTRKPSNIDTAVMAVLNDQVDYHEDVIYENQQQLKYSIEGRTPQAITEEIHLYQEYLDSVYKKNKEIYQKMLATKSIEWRYEKEVRLISQSFNSDKKGMALK